MKADQFDPSQYVQDHASEGEFLVHRDVFRDPEIFDLEMKNIFESSWVFLGLTSQLKKPNDFFTAWIGRQPVIVSRDATGKIHCLLNTCRHRGAIVAHTRQGNERHHICQYHGWAYDSAGKCVSVKDEADALYAEGFSAESHDLVAVPRLAEYRGLLFASLVEDVVPIEEHLGGAKAFIDLVVDQGRDGVELLPGTGTYTFRANWKLQIENCVDGYHLTSTHPSFMKIVERRKLGESRTPLRNIDFNLYGSLSVVSGGFTFPYGHAVLWSGNPAPETRPIFPAIEEVRSRVGDVRARWMLKARNLTLFPNVQFAESASLQMRVIRPIAPDLTEMTIHCIAPVGEASEVRANRIRLYEDFFNSTGLATPDDSQTYEDCQTGFRALSVNRMQGYHRGMKSVQSGADDYARELGIEPATSQNGPFAIQDETLFHACYREWLRLMNKAQRVGGSAP